MVRPGNINPEMVQQFQNAGGTGQRRPANVTPEMMQQFQNMRGTGAGPGAGQGRTRDTAAMRRFMNMRNQQGADPGDTSARRRANPQPGQQSVKQTQPAQTPAAVIK